MKRKLLLPGRFAKIFGGSSRSKAGPSRIAGRWIVQFPDQQTSESSAINGCHMCILE